ncbi:max dimerization protein 4 isoform X2 [Motacilla alba alba]|uniref:max dimerization protein 4 isoform X2 n=1 Tax=Motacilla alba alba TaxID=1094192 RepID=UPI0018D509B1|nr:max dimerization protein 4 isoform X2 [Motacilla alba alba]
MELNSLLILLEAAEYLERRDREAEHGYASVLPFDSDYSRKKTKAGTMARKSQNNRSSHNELEKHSAQSSSPDDALPTNVSSYFHCWFGKEECIKQTKLENQSAQEVILQVSEMYTYSCFGQSCYFAMKDGTKIQFGLNYYVLFLAEVSFGLWSVSGVLGLSSRKLCASWPAKQPAGSRWVRNQVHAFFFHLNLFILLFKHKSIVCQPLMEYVEGGLCFQHMLIDLASSHPAW